METIKITRKIAQVSVAPGAAQPQPGSDVSTAPPGGAGTSQAGTNVVRMHEALERPRTLAGRTYRIKAPTSDHALYVTINDIVLNEGTGHEIRRPFEIFLTSKDSTLVEWTSLTSRLMSAVFRKGGDVTFLVDELRSIHSPQGGYWKSGGDFRPSVIAEIGDVIEEHLQHVGLLVKADSILPAEPEKEQATYVGKAGLFQCGKCRMYAVAREEGCEVCKNCGYSKCG